jgi:DNA repair exonuclease SbcCD ATPase subunit
MAKSNGRLDELATELCNSAEDIQHLLQSLPLKTLRDLRPKEKHYLPETLIKRRLRDAHNHVTNTKVLILKWRETHAPLVQQIAAAVQPEQLEEGIIDVLGLQPSQKVEIREHILCGLLLDERPEISHAVTEEIRAKLLADDGPWQERLTQRKLQRENERVRQDIDRLTAELERTREESKQLQDKLKSALDGQAQNDNQLLNLQVKWEQAQVEINGLKATLEQAKQAPQQVHRHQKTWRDKEQEFKQRITELEHDKHVLVDEKKRALNDAKKLRKELDATTTALEDERRHPRTLLSLRNLEGSWRETVGEIARHLQATTGELKAEDETVSPEERGADWLSWQDAERGAAAALWEDRGEPIGQCLDDLQRAQKLLALRWYLLEGFRWQLAESIRSKSILANDIPVENDHTMGR